MGEVLPGLPHGEDTRERVDAVAAIGQTGAPGLLIAAARWQCPRCEAHHHSPQVRDDVSLGEVRAHLQAITLPLVEGRTIEAPCTCGVVMVVSRSRITTANTQPNRQQRRAVQSARK